MLHRTSTQTGQTELDHGRISPHVAEYFKAAGVSVPSDAVAAPYWGGALMAWASIQDGIVPPIGASDPLAWLAWGSPLSHPVAGAVAILTDGGGRGAHQIGVIARVAGNKVYVVGCFDSSVQTRVVALDRIIATRRPPGAALAISAPVATIEAEVIQAAPAPPVPAPVAQAVPPPPIPVQIPSSQPAVTPEALETLLAAVKSEFAGVYDEIDSIKRHAVAAISLSQD